ncbi:MAG TPA: sigma-70 family RNA polymerase sigma factor [Kofleriaceae bacterium]
MGRITASDAELVEASRKGERAAYGELVARYQRVVCAVGYSATSDRALGEDVAQDTFVAAFQQLDQLRDVSRLREWLCGIARNLARKARRVRDRETASDTIDDAQADASATPFETASEHERDVVVASALARVPDTYREALVLYYVEQRSVPAVASALGISADAVHQRLSRGRQLVATEVAGLVEHTLERRRTRRNLVAGVIAALPLAVIPAHANASNASGGTSTMTKIGIAAALTAALAGTGYAVHRAYAADGSAITSSRASAATATAMTHHHRAGVPLSIGRAHAPHSVPAPPSLPATTAAPALAGANTCASVAAHLASLSTIEGTSSGTFQLTREQVEQMQQAMGSNTMIVVEGSASSLADATAQLEAGLGDHVAEQCELEHWPQELIDCLSTIDSAFAAVTCAASMPDDDDAVGPTPAELAAVTDTSCPAVAAHMATLVAVQVPADRVDIPTVVINQMNAAMGKLATVIEPACESGDWPEHLRRCIAASSSSDEMSGCH